MPTSRLNWVKDVERTFQSARVSVSHPSSGHVLTQLVLQELCKLCKTAHGREILGQCITFTSSEIWESHRKKIHEMSSAWSAGSIVWHCIYINCMIVVASLHHLICFNDVVRLRFSMSRAQFDRVQWFQLYNLSVRFDEILLPREVTCSDRRTKLMKRHVCFLKELALVVHERDRKCSKVICFSFSSHGNGAAGLPASSGNEPRAQRAQRARDFSKLQSHQSEETTIPKRQYKEMFSDKKLIPQKFVF